METRTLGTSDLQLTTVGLGTWAIGGPWEWGWSDQNDKDSVATIHEAIDTGINWVDTAPCYGLGHSEAVVGRALSERTDSVRIATKCGLVWDDPSSGTVFGRLKAESIRQECDASLRRLGVDIIDLYQIHWPNPEEDIEEAWETMASLIVEGKVRHIGVSNFSVAQMRRAQAIHPIASLQPPYSMLAREIESAILPFCREHGIGVIPYSPMQAGLLTGRMTGDRIEALPSDDWRRKDPNFQEPRLGAHLALVEALRAIADEVGATVAQLSIAWVLAQPGISAAIVGARRPGQIIETSGAPAVSLSESHAARIEAVLAKHRERLL